MRTLRSRIGPRPPTSQVADCTRWHTGGSRTAAGAGRAVSGPQSDDGSDRSLAPSVRVPLKSAALGSIAGRRSQQLTWWTPEPAIVTCARPRQTVAGVQLAASGQFR